MTHPLTPEQQACVDFAVGSSDNLLIAALAGAAKTTTLEAIAHALPDTQMMCLAFNKLIATEMAERLPPNCMTKTLNALGLAAWKDTLSTKVTVDTRKMGRIYKALIDAAPKRDKDVMWQSMAYILKSTRQAKAGGHVPDSCATSNTRLQSDEEMFAQLEDEPTAFQQDIIIRVLEESLHEAQRGRIDFDDMLLMPTVFRAIFPRVSLVLVDEAQDLSELNHAMLTKLAKKRLIAVGDQCQAIYAFRGAHNNGMAEMKEKFNMHELTLSTTFRCPEELVEHVRWRAPHMQSWSGSPEGTIIHHVTWSVDNIPDDAAIICRNNAPLFNMAVTLMRAGRFPKLWGNDIAAGLIKIMKKFGVESMKQESVLECITDWENDKLRTTRAPKTVMDRAECLRIFAREADTLGGAIAYAEAIFNSQGPIQLMTGHKAKGHEFPCVFFLDDFLVKDDGQDPNLRYVICTRAQRELHYITSEGCLERREEAA